MELNIKIQKRKLIRKKIGGKYVQYVLTVPKSFVDRHKTSEIYWIANNLLIMAPDKETIFKIIKKIPEIEELLKQRETT